jgi:hypothetical protein
MSDQLCGTPPVATYEVLARENLRLRRVESAARGLLGVVDHARADGMRVPVWVRKACADVEAILKGEMS